jgi:SAM-dependent methyltransferase
VDASAVDWRVWLRRWDAQQQLHLAHREERFAAITTALAAAVGAEPVVLDLGCGPGSLSVRVRERIPGARVVAVDADPVLLAIGRGALGDDRRIDFVDADLRADWAERLPSRRFDAAVSTTALHWLSLSELVRLYSTLGSLIAPGGVLLNGDRLDFDVHQARIAGIAQAVRSGDGRDPGGPGSPAAGAEDWDTWWANASSEPALAEWVAERSARGHAHPRHESPQSYDFHRSALLAAGFAEVGTVWQRLTDRVLIAVR